MLDFGYDDTNQANRQMTEKIGAHYCGHSYGRGKECTRPVSDLFAHCVRHRKPEETERYKLIVRERNRRRAQMDG